MSYMHNISHHIILHRPIHEITHFLTELLFIITHLPRACRVWHCIQREILDESEGLRQAVVAASRDEGLRFPREHAAKRDASPG